MATDLDMRLDGPNTGTLPSARATHEPSPDGLGHSVGVPNAEYVVIKDGYYYRPGSAGYTKNIAEAGRYTLTEAVRESHPNGRSGPRDGLTYERAPEAELDVTTGAPKFSSTYAIVDVMKGRKALARHIAKHGPVRVTIVAEITDPYGSDDGASIEFNANVISITPEISRA